MEYTIERLGPMHYKDMIFLFKHCFHRSVSESFFKRKFNTSYLGIDHLGFMAYSKEGQPAASYSLYPCKMKFKDSQFLGATSGDSMTHIDHRGKGLFDTLARKTYTLAQEANVRLMYAFPNQNTIYPSEKLGFQYPDEFLQTYSIKVNTLPLAKMARQTKITNSVYKAYVGLLLKLFKSESSSFPNSMMSDEFGGVVHDSDFFAYKCYFQNGIVKAGNENVWIKIDGELKIGDVEKREAVDFIRMMKSLKRISFLLGCREIQTTVAEESFLHQGMKSHFKHQQSFMVGRYNLGCEIPIEKIKFTMGDFDTF